jgi:BirA family biotin operon repressor/biotin-[acetyl-CoA-carboxylase] ligase
LILRPQAKPSDAPIITLVAAVAVAETLRFEFQVAADIKWPNDVLVRRRKICGILVEAAIESGRLQYAVMGIGVNIAQRFFPPEIENDATSLLLEAGREISPDEFIEALLPRLDYWYVSGMSRPDQVISRWEELSSSGRDCAVRIESSEGAVEGVSRGLASNGALIVELSNGERREIVAGDVSVRAVGTREPS